MTPGITGMWQVEARDDPSFESYRMFDMFYVENWSLSLDLAIIFSTATAVIMRGVRQMSSRGGDDRSSDSDRGARGQQEPHERSVVLTTTRLASRAAEPAPVASAMAVE